MKRFVFISLLFSALPLATANAATLETRQHMSLKGSLAFESNSIVVIDAGNQKTIVPMSDVARVSFFEAPKTTTLTNAGWTSADIGEVYKPGSTLRTNGTLTLAASGWGLWRDADGLRFASVPLVGDGEIILRVESFDDSDGAVLAGLSIRENLDPCARHI